MQVSELKTMDASPLHTFVSSCLLINGGNTKCAAALLGLVSHGAGTHGVIPVVEYPPISDHTQSFLLCFRFKYHTNL